MKKLSTQCPTVQMSSGFAFSEVQFSRIHLSLHCIFLETYMLVEEVIVHEKVAARIFSFWWRSNQAKCILEQTGVSKVVLDLLLVERIINLNHQYVIDSLSVALCERWHAG